MNQVINDIQSKGWMYTVTNTVIPEEFFRNNANKLDAEQIETNVKTKRK